MTATSTAKSMTWAIRLAAAMLVLSLAYVLMKTVITYTNPESVWESPDLAPISGQRAQQGGVQSFTFTTDPFNRDVAPDTEAIVAIGEDAPETTLNLKLTGRTAGINGTAILRTPDNKEGNYRLGDEIVSGVTLQAVNKDFIVLDVDGELQRLTFERGDNTGLVKKMAADEEAPKTSVTVKTSSAQNSATIQSPEISGDVSKVFQNISLRRVMKNGQLTGYSVKANRPGVDLTPYGFSKGDVVTAIGGTDITRGRPDFINLFEQAANSGGTELTVLRNGQTRIIKLGTP